MKSAKYRCEACAEFEAITLMKNIVDKGLENMIHAIYCINLYKSLTVSSTSVAKRRFFVRSFFSLRRLISPFGGISFMGLDPSLLETICTFILLLVASQSVSWGLAVEAGTERCLRNLCNLFMMTFPSDGSSGPAVK